MKSDSSANGRSLYSTHMDQADIILTWFLQGVRGDLYRLNLIIEEELDEFATTSALFWVR